MPDSAVADPLPRPAAAPRRLAHVAVQNRMAAVRGDWDALLAVVPASPYQTPGWVAAWLEGLGQDITAAFVVGSDDRGPVALLPLGTSRRGGLTVAHFLGGRDGNWGLGLFHPAVDWDAPTLRRLLDQAGRLGGIELFWLANQPHAFDERINPLTALPLQPSPSRQHEATLSGTPETVLAGLLSSRARKHIRQKETKLAAIGLVGHDVAEEAAAAERIATALLAQRAARFGPTGREAALVRYLTAAAAPPCGAPPAVELHALRCGDTIVAAFAGARHADRFSGMLVSFASDPAWARFSPGELLIARIMAAQRRSGIAVFDLGIGEARYKESFCAVAVPLFDTVVGIGFRGRIAAYGLRAALSAKRRIKQAPRLWPVLDRWRSRLRRPSGRDAPRG